MYFACIYNIIQDILKDYCRGMVELLYLSSDIIGARYNFYTKLTIYCQGIALITRF